MRKTKRNRSIAAVLLWLITWFSMACVTYEAYCSRFNSRAMIVSITHSLLMLTTYALFGCYSADSRLELDRRRGLFRLSLIILIMVTHSKDWRAAAFWVLIWWPFAGALTLYTRYSQKTENQEKSSDL